MPNNIKITYSGGQLDLQNNKEVKFEKEMEYLNQIGPDPQTTNIL